MNDNLFSTAPPSSSLFVALIVPDAQRRRTLSLAVAGIPHAIAREFGENPMPDDASAFEKLSCDVALVDLDGDTDRALRTIEIVCAENPETTVMAYSGKADLALARRAMRAGARDFLAEPVETENLRDAIDRIPSRRVREEKSPGKLLLFAPAKRGVGVTFAATNFAVALATESRARVVLVDLDMQLGDAALGLGLRATCSVADALQNPARLDREFLSELLLRHKSGLAVLGSPENYSFCTSQVEDGARKLFSVLRQEFDYVVVDTGSCHGPIQEALVDKADAMYLVTELSFPALRNAHRLIATLMAKRESPHVEVVLNRCDAPNGGIDEVLARKAIGRPINWRFPDGLAAVRKSWDRGVPVVTESSPLATALVQMARAACGKSAPPAKPGRMFNFFDSKIRAQSVAI